jgi:hypothetical protein
LPISQTHVRNRVGRRIGTNFSPAALPARLEGLDASLLVAAYTELAR